MEFQVGDTVKVVITRHDELKGKIGFIVAGSTDDPEQEGTWRVVFPDDNGGKTPEYLYLYGKSLELLYRYSPPYEPQAGDVVYYDGTACMVVSWIYELGKALSAPWPVGKVYVRYPGGTFASPNISDLTLVWRYSEQKEDNE